KIHGFVGNEYLAVKMSSDCNHGHCNDSRSDSLKHIQDAISRRSTSKSDTAHPAHPTKRASFHPAPPPDPPGAQTSAAAPGNPRSSPNHTVSPSPDRTLRAAPPPPSVE